MVSEMTAEKADNQPHKGLFTKALAAVAATVGIGAGFVGLDRFTGETTAVINVSGIENRTFGIEIGPISLLNHTNVLRGRGGEQYLLPDGMPIGAAGADTKVSFNHDWIAFTPPLQREITTVGHGYTGLPKIKEIKVHDAVKNVAR